MKETLTLLERCQREAREKLLKLYREHNLLKHNVFSTTNQDERYEKEFFDELDLAIANTLKQAAEEIEKLKENIDVTYGEQYWATVVEEKIIDALTDAQKVIRGEDNG